MLFDYVPDEIQLPLCTQTPFQNPPPHRTGPSQSWRFTSSCSHVFAFAFSPSETYRGGESSVFPFQLQIRGGGISFSPHAAPPDDAAHFLLVSKDTLFYSARHPNRVVHSHALCLFTFWMYNICFTLVVDPSLNIFGKPDPN